MGLTWRRRLAVILFALGLLMGMALAGVIAWGDMEGSLFDPSISPDASLNTLRCPILITSAETSTVSAAVHNPLDRPVTLFVMTHISSGFVTLMREARAWVTLAPGETQRLEWAVTPDDAAFGSVILVRVHVLRNGPLPYRQGTCGIVVVGVPYVTGSQILAGALAIALLGTAGGIGLWVANNRPLLRRSLVVAQVMAVLAGTVGTALVVGFFGLWFIALLALLFALLLIVVLMAHLAITAP